MCCLFRYFSALSIVFPQAIDTVIITFSTVSELLTFLSVLFTLRFSQVLEWDCAYSSHQNPWALFPQHKKSFFEIHSTKKRRFSFSGVFVNFANMVFCNSPV